MKNKKILILLVLIAVALITGGIIGTIPSSTTNTPKDAIPKEDREYKTIKQETEIVNPLSKEDNGFANTAKEAGFKETKCETNNCVASNKGYTNYDGEDTVVYAYEEDKPSNISVVLHFHKDDYTAKNIVSNLNSVIGNYTKANLDEAFVSDTMDGLKSTSDGFYIKTKIVDNYTVELNIMPVADSDFYIVKYWLVQTSIYSQMNNAQ